ncbi:MAG TPA: NusA-like transcription termination signal-binding factor [Candidatus Thermoplasmatota archaeon]|nr:NusA-like transcription termination signal-binding factor [Candidatus Thermoplasmatota archaeon]
MVEIVLDTETLRLIVLFERTTGARVKDCLDQDGRQVFVVEDGDLGKALGRGAVNLKKLRDVLNREVEIVGFSQDREQFVKNLFHRFELESIAFDERNDGTVSARVKVKADDKGKAIGKGGRNIGLARMLAQRHHQLADVQIE